MTKIWNLVKQILTAITNQREAYRQRYIFVTWTNISETGTRRITLSDEIFSGDEEVILLLTKYLRDNNLLEQYVSWRVDLESGMIKMNTHFNAFSYSDESAYRAKWDREPFRALEFPK